MAFNRRGMISIIMAAYNAESTIRKAIDSVLMQSFSDYELIVVDDCSIDSTAEIVKEYAAKDSRVKLLRNSCNSGVSASRLYGLKKTEGEWIAILDSDDAWMPLKLEKQMELQRDTGADLIYSGSLYMDSEGSRIKGVFHVPKVITYRRLLKQNVIFNSSSLVRKELYSEYYVSGDDLHEDYAVWLKILKTGRKACGINEPLLIYRITDTSKSGNKLKSAVMNWKTYRYVGLKPAEAAYYMFWYAVNGISKYIHIGSEYKING